jgi:hypothetical protein
MFYGTGFIAFAAALAAGCGDGTPDAASTDVFEELGPASFATGEELGRHHRMNARAVWSDLDEFKIDGWSEDPACPRVTVDGDTVTVEGGCTDAEGKVWSGRATRTGTMASRNWTGTFDGVTVEDTHACEDGSVVSEVWRVEGTGGAADRGDGHVAFFVDVRIERTVLEAGTCADPGVYTVVQRFAGTFDETGGDRALDVAPDRVVWNGRGILGDSDDGVATVETTDVVFEKAVCDSEAISGRTVLTAGGHRAEMLHDGATDCDSTQTVKWTYDGRDMGEAEVSACAVRRPGAGADARALLPVLALLAGLVALRSGLRRRAG